MENSFLLKFSKLLEKLVSNIYITLKYYNENIYFKLLSKRISILYFNNSILCFKLHYKKIFINKCVFLIANYVYYEYLLIYGNLGSRGGITQVKCQFLNNTGRQIVRNVKGPVRKGDILALLESEREARRLR